MQLILASSSQGRRQLLSLFKIPFSVIPAKLDEYKIRTKTPLETLNLRAKLKGEEVAAKIIASHKSLKLIKQPMSDRKIHLYLIISADSGAILNGKLYGKPTDEKAARKTFHLFSGRTHLFITSIFVISLTKGPNDKEFRRKTWQLADESLVTMRKLSEEDIKLHLKYSQYTKYAGGYALFASPVDLISKVEGSLTNVIGLPLSKLTPILQQNHLL